MKKLIKIIKEKVKKIGLILLIWNLSSYASYSYANEPDVSDANEIDLIGPVGVTVPIGVSNWSGRLDQPMYVNPLKVLYWNNGQCPVIPITSVSVKFVNSNYWYSTKFGNNGYYYANNSYGPVEAIRLNLYQNQQQEFCLVKISGYVFNQ